MQKALSKANAKEENVGYAEHVLRGSGGYTHLYILEGKVAGKRPRGRPRLPWRNGILLFYIDQD